MYICKTHKKRIQREQNGLSIYISKYGKYYILFLIDEISSEKK